MSDTRTSCQINKHFGTSKTDLFKQFEKLLKIPKNGQNYYPEPKYHKTYIKKKKQKMFDANSNQSNLNQFSIVLFVCLSESKSLNKINIKHKTIALF